MPPGSPYAELGLDPNCTEQDIKKAFKQLSLKYHPDKCPGDAGGTKFKNVLAAYNLLKDPDSRRKYDLEARFRAGSYPDAHMRAQAQAAQAQREPYAAARAQASDAFHAAKERRGEYFSRSDAKSEYFFNAAEEIQRRSAERARREEAQLRRQREAVQRAQLEEKYRRAQAKMASDRAKREELARQRQQAEQREREREHQEQARQAQARQAQRRAMEEALAHEKAAWERLQQVQMREQAARAQAAAEEAALRKEAEAKAARNKASGRYFSTRPPVIDLTDDLTDELPPPSPPPERPASKKRQHSEDFTPNKRQHKDALDMDNLDLPESVPEQYKPKPGSWYEQGAPRSSAPGSLRDTYLKAVNIGFDTSRRLATYFEALKSHIPPDGALQLPQPPEQLDALLEQLRAPLRELSDELARAQALNQNLQ